MGDIGLVVRCATLVFIKPAIRFLGFFQPPSIRHQRGPDQTKIKFSQALRSVQI